MIYESGVGSDVISVYLCASSQGRAWRSKQGWGPSGVGRRGGSKVWKDIANMGPHSQNVVEIMKKGTQFLIGNEG